MTFRLALLTLLLLVCPLPGIADQGVADQEKKSIDLLKQIKEETVAALTSGCVLDSKWLFKTRRGAPVPLNMERSFRMAVKGEYLLVESWCSGRYDTTTKTMVSARDTDSRAAYGGLKYIETDGGRYVVSKDPANIVAIFDAFQAYPLTSMFAFLVPRQGYVTFQDVASAANWSAYLSNITHVAFDAAGNMIVTSLRSDGIGQEVTFSVANGFYPSRIKLSWDDKQEITEVLDWAKTDAFGENLRFVPTTIVMKIGKKGADMTPGWKITLDPQSVAKLPDTTHYFNLPVASGAPLHDMDVNADVLVP